MIAYSTTTTGGALISALSAVSEAGTFSRLLAAHFSHSTDANAVIRDGSGGSATGTILCTLRTVDEDEADDFTWPGEGYPLSDVYYDITTGGTLILYVE